MNLSGACIDMPAQAPHRPRAIYACFLALAVAAASAHAQKSDINLALGMTPEQIGALSTGTIQWSLRPIGKKGMRTGGAFVTSPHRLAYKDQALTLSFPHAGNHRSMPTSLSVLDDSLDIVSVSALGEYAELKTAIAESKRLLAELQAQGFDYVPENPTRSTYSKFYLARRNSLGTPPAPRSVNSFKEMEAAFLNSQYYLEEFVVFALRKGDMRTTLRVTNMRRRHTEGRISATGPILSVRERAVREAQTLDRASLEIERAYHLEVSIARALDTGGAR